MATGTRRKRRRTTGTRNGRTLDIRESIIIAIADGKITFLRRVPRRLAYEAFWE